MVAIKKKKSKKKSNLLRNNKYFRIIILCTIALVIVITYLTGPRGTIRMFRDVQKKQDLIQEIEQLELTKAELDSIKNRLENDPTYIERIAREEYNMKKKGEKVIKIETDSK